MDKKGSVVDLFLIVVVMLVMGVILVVSLYLKDSIFAPLRTQMGTDAGFNTTINTTEAAFGSLDGLFILSFILLNGAIILMAALIPSHPVFLVINIVLLIFLFVITPTISNIMNTVWSNPNLSVYAAGGGGSTTLPITSRLFQYLPIIMLVISVIVCLVTYSKGGGGGY